MKSRLIKHGIPGAYMVFIFYINIYLNRVNYSKNNGVKDLLFIHYTAENMHSSLVRSFYKSNLVSLDTESFLVCIFNIYNSTYPNIWLLIRVYAGSSTHSPDLIIPLNLKKDSSVILFLCFTTQFTLPLKRNSL